MKDVMGIIYTGENDARLRELTLTRAIAALPVAGRYRVIDFHVSSMVNAGIRNVGVIMQKNYHSLMDHLGSGKEWDLHGKINGLHILPPFLTRENIGVYNGWLDALRSNTNYLTRSKQEIVVLSNSNVIYNANLDEMVSFFETSGADITMMYTDEPSMRMDDYGTYFSLDENNNVTDMEVEPTHPHLEHTYMEVLVMRREYMRSLVDRAVAHGLHDLGREVIMRMVQEKQTRINAFEYKGEAWRMASVQDYFRFNLDMLNPEKRAALFASDLPIYTKVRDEMPAYYSSTSHAVNSLIADGCIIEGTVENSILFRGVKIAPDAHVRNCVIMQDGQVQSGAYIENCIIDKQAVIKRNAKLIGPEVYPIVIAKNVVI